MALLEKAEPIDEPGKNANLRRTLLITGRDGYTVALAVGEIDPHYEGKQVIVAYSGGDPPASMTFLRLVVPGDVHGGRSVRDIATIELRYRDHNLGSESKAGTSASQWKHGNDRPEGLQGAGEQSVSGAECGMSGPAAARCV